MNCGQAAIALEALETWSESLLAKLIRVTPGAAPRNPVLERFLHRIEECKIPVIIGLLPLSSYKMAEFLNYEVPGCSVPDSILDRMRKAETPEAGRAEGIRIAQDILSKVQGMVQGVQVRGPFDQYATAVEVLSVLNMKGAPH